MEYIEYKDHQFLEWEKIYTSYDEVKDREDLPEWFKQCLHHVGEKYKNSGNEVFTLKGMSETNEDYYYYGTKENGEEYFDTCVDKVKRVMEKYILVKWPKSQALMDDPRFSECILCVDSEGQEELVGDSAYMCPEDLYNEIFKKH